MCKKRSAVQRSAAQCSAVHRSAAQCSAAHRSYALFLSHEDYFLLLSNDKIEFVTQKKRNAVQRRSALINIRYKRINYSHNDFVQQQQ